jgi:hypothetical protein
MIFRVMRHSRRNLPSYLRQTRRLTDVTLYAFFIVISVPIVIGVLWGYEIISVPPWRLGLGPIGAWSLFACPIVLYLALLHDYYRLRSPIKHVCACNCTACTECGHNLTGLPERHACPECGHWYDLKEVKARWAGVLGVPVPDPEAASRQPAENEQAAGATDEVEKPARKDC